MGKAAAAKGAANALEGLWKFILPRLNRFWVVLKTISGRLVVFLEKGLKKLERVVKSIAKFAKELGSKIGKATVQQLLKLPALLRKALNALKKNIAFAMKLAKNLMGLVKSKLDPVRLLKLVKAQIAQFAKRFRMVWQTVREILNVVNPLQAALSVIGYARMVLQMIFDWIKDVVDAEKAIKQCKKAVQDVVKMLKREMGELTKVVKNTNAFKLPA